MKKFILFTFISLSIVSCKTEIKTEKKYEDDKEVRNPEPIRVEKEKMTTTAEAIAQAHGIKKWNNVKEIKFTFNVDRDTTHYERSWSWKPKEDIVTLITAEDTITYNRNNIDSLSVKADQGFINDKFWLLAPFNLVWDASSYNSTLKVNEVAPISGKQMQKLTVVYNNKGGYTPGDAYDFYFEGDFIIKEWVFRKKNTEKPSLITSWEDYKNFDGIKIAKAHRKNEGDWKLHFTNVEVTRE
ncbi:hypothetical protein [Aquimarina sp. MMG016]|uniref:hypothetical protein n=1 Tax=Aquimarina sp. MMG016 TaxID=2822690 RepID=UPI001B3A11A4|nr:hypothetical protein [Aquimarina sp. MMG016]MBQ4822247.1 hypothetical protein [Aquimarina sp. MMG016]